MTPYSCFQIPHLGGFLGTLLPILPEYLFGGFRFTRAPEGWRTEKGFHLLRMSLIILSLFVALIVGICKASCRGIILGVSPNRSRRPNVSLNEMQVTWNLCSFLHLDFHAGYQAVHRRRDGPSTAESQPPLWKRLHEEEGSSHVQLTILSGEGDAS